MADPFVGELRLVAFNYPPQGWLSADGAMYNPTQFAALFALFGTTYGGDGVRTFGVPNLVGRVAMCVGQITPEYSYALGQPGGFDSVTLNVSNVPSHSHSLMATSTKGNLGAPSGNALADAKDASGVLYVNNSPATAMSTAAVSTYTGGQNQPHENRMPFQTLNWIIAVIGVYPPHP